MRRWTWVLAAALTAGLMLPLAAPAHAASSPPRIEGEFAVTQTVIKSVNGTAPGSVSSAVIGMTPQCTSGSCATTLRRTRGEGTVLNYTLKPIASTTSYQGSLSYLGPCFLTNGGTVSGAYNYSETATIAGPTSMNGYATTITGALVVSYTPTAKGTANGCGAGSIELQLKGKHRVFSCTTPGRSAKVATPEYEARIQVRAAPDPTLFMFGARLTACWNGQAAAIGSGTVYPDVASGVVPGVLSGFGFDLEYDPSEAGFVASKSPNGSASATTWANYYVSFRWAEVAAGLGLGKALKPAEKWLAKTLQKWFKKHGVKASAAVIAVGEKATALSTKVQKAVREGLKKKLEKKRVPGPVAGWLAKKVAKVVEKLSLKAWKVRSLVFPASYRKESSKQYAKRISKIVVGQVKKLASPDIRFIAWEARYDFELTKSGSLSVHKRKGYLNPFLNVHKA